MPGSARDDMLSTAADLFRSHGPSGTSLSDVVAASGAPRGSIYHHFPGGKSQLTREAVMSAGVVFEDFLRSLPATTPAEFVTAVGARVHNHVFSSRITRGCVVAALTLDTDLGDPLIEVPRAVFRGWIQATADNFAACGMSERDAAGWATMVMASIEGALVLCRAEGSTDPLDIVIGQLLRSLPAT